MSLPRSFAVLVAILLLVAPASAQNAGHADVPIYAIDHGGAERHFGLYVPAGYSRGRHAPVIIALHGRMSSAKAFHIQSGLAAVADAQGAIIVYPETHGRFWNDGGHAALERGEAPSDDIGFINALIDAVANDYTIDRARVFAVGHDQGGSLAYRLACAHTTPLAGVASVNAPMWEFTTAACQAQPAPTLIMQGARDQYAAIDESRAPASRPIEQTVAFWRGINGCTDASSTRGRAGSALYASCQSGAPVAYVAVNRGSHDWFRVREGRVLNRNNVDAAAIFSEFFFRGGAITFPDERSIGVRTQSSTIYVPPTYDASRPTPAVMVLHGRPGTGIGIAAITRLNAVAARNGFIVIYPDGPNNEWHSAALSEGERAADRRDAGPSARDDIRDLEQLLDDLRLDFNIDPSRIYLTGFSNGAIMTARMSCTSADRFAALAVVGGAFYDIFREECDGSPPTPILFMHGTGDRSVRYEGVSLPIGQDGVLVRIADSIPDAVQYYARHNGCSADGARRDFPQRGQSPGTNVSHLLLNNCSSGKPVSFYVINGGGHNWPGADTLNREIFGDVSMDIDAGEELWSFFSQQTLRPR